MRGWLAVAAALAGCAVERTLPDAPVIATHVWCAAVRGDRVAWTTDDGNGPAFFRDGVELGGVVADVYGPDFGGPYVLGGADGFVFGRTKSFETFLTAQFVADGSESESGIEIIPPSQSGDLALDEIGGKLVLADDDRELVHIDIATGAVTRDLVIGGEDTGISASAAAGDSLFLFVHAARGAYLAMLDRYAPTQLWPLTTGDRNVTRLTVGEGAIYWIEPDTPTQLYAAPAVRGGGPAVALASFATRVDGIAYAAGAVWVSTGADARASQLVRVDVATGARDAFDAPYPPSELAAADGELVVTSPDPDADPDDFAGYPLRRQPLPW